MGSEYDMKARSKKAQARLVKEGQGAWTLTSNNQIQTVGGATMSDPPPMNPQSLDPSPVSQPPSLPPPLRPSSPNSRSLILPPLNPQSADPPLGSQPPPIHPSPIPSPPVQTSPVTPPSLLLYTFLFLDGTCVTFKHQILQMIKYSIVPRKVE
jgi:hypothetical protein